jgi:hypothetical protein
VNEPNTSGAALAAGPFGCTSVLNPATGNASFGQVGPCNDVANGFSVF